VLNQELTTAQIKTNSCIINICQAEATNRRQSIYPKMEHLHVAERMHNLNPRLLTYQSGPHTFSDFTSWRGHALKHQQPTQTSKFNLWTRKPWLKDPKIVKAETTYSSVGDKCPSQMSLTCHCPRSVWMKFDTKLNRHIALISRKTLQSAKMTYKRRSLIFAREHPWLVQVLANVVRVCHLAIRNFTCWWIWRGSEKITLKTKLCGNFVSGTPWIGYSRP